jgi:hypothetical protein
MIDMISIDIAYAYFVTCFATENVLDIKGAVACAGNIQTFQLWRKLQIIMWTEKKARKTLDQEVSV